MKKIIMPLAALALMGASCSTDTKDSYTTYAFGEYNLIVDTENESAPAIVSTAVYDLKMIWSQGTVDVKTSDLIFDNQKYSFETRPMTLSVTSVKDPFSDYYVQQGEFSAAGSVGEGSQVTDIKGFYTSGVYVVNSVSVPGFNTITTVGPRLVMNYTFNNRYQVQTFWPECFYIGESVSSNSMMTGDSDDPIVTDMYTTKNTAYRVQLDFQKKTAKVVIYNPEYKLEDEDAPKAIVVEDIPITLHHDGYYLNAESPKTQILVTKDGRDVLADAGKYAVSNFSLTPSSRELTSCSIIYQADGNLVMFKGNAIVIPQAQ